MEQTETTDIILKCVDCGLNFILTVNECNFYNERQLHLPKRCPSCRARRRQERETQDHHQSEVSDG